MGRPELIARPPPPRGPIGFNLYLYLHLCLCPRLCAPFSGCRPPEESAKEQVGELVPEFPWSFSVGVWIFMIVGLGEREKESSEFHVSAASWRISCLFPLAPVWRFALSLTVAIVESLVRVSSDARELEMDLNFQRNSHQIRSPQLPATFARCDPLYMYINHQSNQRAPNEMGSNGAARAGWRCKWLARQR